MKARAALGILIAAAAAVALAAAQEPPKPTFKLGVVNLKTCFQPENYARIKEIQAESDKFREEGKKQVQDLEKKISQTREQLEGLDRGQPLYLDKLMKLRITEAELKYTRELNQIRLREQTGELIRETYNEIRNVVSKVGKENSYDLILRVEEPVIEGEDPVSVNQQIAGRMVLHHLDTVDVTPLVLKRLNEEHAKKRPPAPDWECPTCKKPVKDVKCPVCGAQKK